MSSNSKSEIYVPSLPRIASYFADSRISGYIATCPVCKSNSLSLRIEPYASSVSIRCGTGCSRNAILDAVNLDAAILYAKYGLTNGLTPLTPDQTKGDITPTLQPTNTSTETDTSTTTTTTGGEHEA